jgi:hypothetical protein
MRCHHPEGCSRWAYYADADPSRRAPRFCARHRREGQVRAAYSNSTGGTGAALAGPTTCPRCQSRVSRRNLAKHRRSSRCAREARRLAATGRAWRVGRDLTAALRGRLMYRHPSLSSSPAPHAELFIAAADGRNETRSGAGNFTGACSACRRRKKGLAHCRVRLGHTEAGPARALATSLRKTSQFVGVGWSEQKGRWRVRVVVGGRAQHVGFFDDELEVTNPNLD